MEEEGTPTVLLFVLSITAGRKYVKLHLILTLTYAHFTRTTRL